MSPRRMSECLDDELGGEAESSDPTERGISIPLCASVRSGPGYHPTPSTIQNSQSPSKIQAGPQQTVIWGLGWAQQNEFVSEVKR